MWGDVKMNKSLLRKTALKCNMTAIETHLLIMNISDSSGML